MRTCPKCGCYIPDNWITCPACSAQVVNNKSIPVRENNHLLYRVDVLYDYERIKTCEYFGMYENAVKYATRKAKENDVFATQIISGGRIISTIGY